MIINQTQAEKNTLTIRTVLGIFFGLILTINTFFLLRHKAVFNSEKEITTAIESQQELYFSINETVLLALNDTNVNSASINSSLLEFEQLNSKIVGLSNDLDLERTKTPINVSVSYKLISKEFSSLVHLVLDKRMESYFNRSLIESRLKKTGINYENVILQIQTASLRKTASFEHITFIILLFMVAGMIAIAVASHFLLFVPFSLVNKDLLEKIDFENIQLHKQENIVKVTKEKESKTNSLLKVKSAQVLKLQESLELAIAFSNKTQQDKNLIYFNIASDLSEYIKVLSLQHKIIENQTPLEGNENWITLTNTISQLNSITGNYFNHAKNGQNDQQHGEVYLTPLMSEIVISMDEDSPITFEQVSDMPTIKTDMELLKRVLKPYFHLMTLKAGKSTINYSAKEDGSFCEIKFLGLLPQFQNQLEQLEQKELADFTFDEFKVHMSNKIIVERGGKYWVQFEVGKTGVFTIYWPL